MTQIITRAEVKARGLPRYFTGKPCKHGHVAERLTSSGECVECGRKRARETMRQRRAADPERVREQERQYRAANREAVKDRKRRHYAANRDKINEQQRQRRAADPEKFRARDRQWCAANADYLREYARQWYAANTERVREYALQWYAANGDAQRNHRRERYANDPEYRGTINEQQRQYRAANREKFRARDRRWRAENPEKVRKHAQRWREENPDYQRDYRRERYANDPEFRDQVFLRRVILRVARTTAGDGALRHLPPGRSEAIRAKIEADLAAIPDAPDSFDDLDRSEWHLDHVVPVSVMLELLPDEPRPVLAYVASHPDMLRPLPATENISRGNRLDDDADTAFERFVEIIDEARAYHGEY